MKNIYPCLWFDDKAEDAANFYVSIFTNSKITSLSRYGDSGPLPKGTVMVAKFHLNGQEFMALNGGPEFQFTPAISLMVKCKTQQEIDEYWNQLTAGGKEVQCGWLEDRFGVSWQIVPEIMDEYLKDKDPERTERVMAAMMKMVKLDIATLKQAHDYTDLPLPR